MKKIAILGSTGTIGKTLIQTLKKNKKKIKVVCLSANKNYKLILKQSKELNVKNLIITDYSSYRKLLAINKNKKLKIFNSFSFFKKIFTSKVDYVLSAISGLDGLYPTLKIIRYTNTIAIANKESIICGWNLISTQLKKNKTNFVPVDSEHYSIWYALQNNNDKIEKVSLTASGGPFYRLPVKKFKKISVNQALKHPNWKMGKKISIDSATMMNKVFEVIEAKRIFNLKKSQLEILIHTNSYIHAILKFKNGMIKLIAHETNMKIPIINSLDFKLLSNDKYKKLNLNLLNNLDLNKVSNKRYPMVNILKLLNEKQSLFETIIVSANDELVNLFLNKEIEFVDIYKKLSKFIKLDKFLLYKTKKPKNIRDIVKLNDDVKTYIKLNFKKL